MMKTKCFAKQLVNSSWHKQIRQISAIKKVSLPSGLLHNSRTQQHSCIAAKINAKNFHSSPLRQKEDGRKVQTKVFTISNPFKFFSLKIKLLLMRGYFDPKFTEKEFLTGARQAVLFITEKIASGDFEDLNDVMTPDGLQCAHQLYNSHHQESSHLVIDDSDIMKVSLHDIGFEYGESGQKWAYALIICYCSGKNSFTRTQTENFDIEIMASQPRILNISFRREYTPGINAGWLVDQLDYKNMLKL